MLGVSSDGGTLSTQSVRLSRCTVSDDLETLSCPDTTEQPPPPNVNVPRRSSSCPDLHYGRPGDADEAVDVVVGL